MSHPMDIFIQPAVMEFIENNNPEPMIKFIESKHTSLLECDMARELLVSLLRGDKVRGRGKKIPHNIDRDNRICRAIAYLKGRKYTIYDENKACACSFIAAIVHLNSEHIYKRIWKPACDKGKKPIKYPLTLRYSRSPAYPSMMTKVYEESGQKGDPKDDEAMVRMILEKPDTK